MLSSNHLNSLKPQAIWNDHTEQFLWLPCVTVVCLNYGKCRYLQCTYIADWHELQHLRGQFKLFTMKISTLWSLSRNAPLGIRTASFATSHYKIFQNCGRLRCAVSSMLTGDRWTPHIKAVKLSIIVIILCCIGTHLTQVMKVWVKMPLLKEAC